MATVNAVARSGDDGARVGAPGVTAGPDDGVLVVTTRVAAVGDAASTGADDTADVADDLVVVDPADVVTVDAVSVGALLGGVLGRSRLRGSRLRGRRLSRPRSVNRAAAG